MGCETEVARGSRNQSRKELAFRDPEFAGHTQKAARKRRAPAGDAPHLHFRRATRKRKRAGFSPFPVRLSCVVPARRERGEAVFRGVW